MRAAAQQALEALEYLVPMCEEDWQNYGPATGGKLGIRQARAAIEALRTALAQPENITAAELAERVARGEKFRVIEL